MNILISAGLTSNMTDHDINNPNLNYYRKKNRGQKKKTGGKKFSILFFLLLGCIIGIIVFSLCCLFVEHIELLVRSYEKQILLKPL